MNLRPLGDRLIVRPIEEDEMTAGGVILPSIAQEKSTRGTVLAVGPGTRHTQFVDVLAPVDAEAGDIVVYSRYGGTEVDHNGETLLILREQDVLAKVEPE